MKKNSVTILQKLLPVSAIFLLLLFPFLIKAQEIPKRTLVEHFTNTYCSVCASRNPGFYSNLVQFPNVIHLSYYPSAPYPACPLDQYNIQQQDDRTNFYGIYGGTPRLVINGNVIAANMPYDDPSLFQLVQADMTPYDLRVEVAQPHPDSVQVSMIIKKVSADNHLTAEVYAAIVEDTLFFNANNGETEHYDVFRKAFWGNATLENLPALVGDSVVYTRSVPYDAVWTRSRVYAIGMIQQEGSHTLLQTARSGKLPPAASVAGIPSGTQLLTIFPNPATRYIRLSGINNIHQVYIMDINGRVLSTGMSVDGFMNIQHLPNGLYIIKILNNKGTYFGRFLKINVI